VILRHIRLNNLTQLASGHDELHLQAMFPTKPSPQAYLLFQRAVQLQETDHWQWSFPLGCSLTAHHDDTGIVTP
jgi:hypothetical protein